MTELKLISVDTSKHVFTLHGVGDRGEVVLRRELRRQQLEGFFAKLPPMEVVLEACGGSHHWGRVLMALGHRVRLIPPQYVKPFVKRNKNDRADAEAMCEAAVRPGINFVPVKSAEQQAAAMVLSVRELLVKQHTQLVNAVRGHAAEFGVIDQRAELRPHGGCLAVQVGASSRRLARPDAEAEVDGGQAAAGRDLAPGQRTAATVAGARRNRRGPHCQTRQPACQHLAAGPAAAPSAQARGGRPGQQDGPCRVGHDDQR